MSMTPQNNAETDHSSRTIYIIVIAVSLLLVAGLAYLATRPSAPIVVVTRLRSVAR